MNPRWVRAVEVMSRPTARGSVALRADGRVAVTLTGLDHDVWALLAEPSTAPALTDRLVHHAQHGTAPDEAAVVRSLDRLATRGLIEHAVDTPAVAGIGALEP